MDFVQYMGMYVDIGATFQVHPWTVEVTEYSFGLERVLVHMAEESWRGSRSVFSPNVFLVLRSHVL